MVDGKSFGQTGSFGFPEAGAIELNKQKKSAYSFGKNAEQKKSLTDEVFQWYNYPY
ncbi:hypothetical protein [Paenibacillus sp. Pae108]|uniref:hypothetical protein n=1 Tax=Paenibacillus sp. Pae108 TaxID=2926019 RepID=UPI00211800C3|nr:hypothetical protein [Paenibacillus sp. Pae108]